MKRKSIDERIRFRTLLMGCLFSVFFAGIVAKAVYLQVYRGPWLARKAARQYEISVVTYGKRGTIYNANQREMAVSVDVASIAAFPPRIQNARVAAKDLSKALRIKKDDVYKKLISQKTFVWIKRHVTPREAKAVKALNLEGISLSRRGVVFIRIKPWPPR